MILFIFKALEFLLNIMFTFDDIEANDSYILDNYFINNSVNENE